MYLKFNVAFRICIIMLDTPKMNLNLFCNDYFGNSYQHWMSASIVDFSVAIVINAAHKRLHNAIVINNGNYVIHRRRAASCVAVSSLWQSKTLARVYPLPKQTLRMMHTYARLLTMMNLIK